MERLQLIWSKGTYSQNFNPRSDERSDPFSIFLDGPEVNFNPRSDERSDVVFAAILSKAENFNPRSDERSDW